ncbi:hypothetical protein WAI453_012173 [Rhynchosporium graminicola]
MFGQIGTLHLLWEEGRLADFTSLGSKRIPNSVPSIPPIQAARILIAFKKASCRVNLFPFQPPRSPPFLHVGGDGRRILTDGQVMETVRPMIEVKGVSSFPS